VLELGSGPGTVTKALNENDCQVSALEIDESAIELVRPLCKEVHQCDFNDPNWPDEFSELGKFDVIVAADVFEHLYDPLTSLEATHQFLRDDGCLVVSLPHAGHLGIVACLLNSDFDYGLWGLLDSTHIRFFGLKNIQDLFENANFKITEVEFVVRRPEDSELAPHWKRLSAEVRNALASAEFGNIYQVVRRAVPTSAKGQALKLDSSAIPSPQKKSTLKRIQNSTIGNYLKKVVPPGVKDKIRQVLRRT